MANDKRKIEFTLEQIYAEIVKRWKVSLDKHK